MAILWCFKLCADIFQNIFEIFSAIVSNTKSHTGRCHMIYWCFLIVCHLSFHWNFAQCEHFICRHSQKLQCTPSNIPEHWTFQLTSHRQMFLIFYTHWSGEVFEGWSGNWPELSTFKEFFQICSKKHGTLKQFDTPCQFLQMPYVMF